MNQNPRIEEAARILGASGWRVWWHIRLPLLQPAIAAAAVLVFVFTFTSFGVVLLLGGPRFATLEVEIYRQTANLFNLPVAAALSLIQIVIMFTMMLIYTRLQSRITVGLVSAQAIGRSPSSLAQRLLVILTLSFMGVMLFVPLLALLVMSFTVGGNGFNVQYFQQLGVNARNSVLFVPPVQAIGNSLLFAVLTTVLAVILGVLTAYIVARRGRGWFSFLDPLFALPLAVSAATLGFGYIISFDSPPLNIRSSPLLIPVAHTLVAMPFVVRSLLPALRSIPSNLQESGRMLGAEPARVWWYIEFPLISQALLVGATFAFTVSMGEFGASLFIARPDTPTIPIVIFRLLGQPGVSNYGQALAMSTILMVVCAACFVLIERLRAVGVGEF
ncbi:MAG: iron ABC transporter permease [Anaerolineae bacterium]